MATGRAVRKRKPAAKTAAKALTGPGAAVQEALQVTWLLKGNLKNAQLSYIRVGVLLARVRDGKLYAALGHPDMEHYAGERLHLGRSALYKYLQVHDWIRDCHPEWLLPRPKGFIPDLNDVADLIYIERELARKDLPEESRASLEGLKGKALAGTLKASDLKPYRRRQGAGTDGRRLILARLRNLRNKSAQLAGMPPEALSYLDAAINVLKHAVTLRLAGLDSGEAGKRSSAA